MENHAGEGKHQAKNVHDLLKQHKETLETMARYFKLDDPCDIPALKVAGTPFLENLQRIEQDFILISRVLRISFDMNNATSVSRFLRKAMRRTLNLRQTRLTEFINREFTRE